MEKKYRYDLDLLKGVALIAIVLYHAGWCKSGYLGVDLFFVLNGYLVIPKILNDIEGGHFHYFAFLEKKIFRLLPLVLFVSGLSLVVGYWGMLPHEFRFLSEEAVAASTFMNNALAILCCLAGLTLMLSTITYYFMEKRILISKTSQFSLILSFLIVNSFALWIFKPYTSM